MIDGQFDLSGVFDRHAERSDMSRVAGNYDVWVFDRCTQQWKHYSDLTAEKQSALSALCLQHGQQVYFSQWDFTDEAFQQVLALLDAPDPQERNDGLPDFVG